MGNRFDDLVDVHWNDALRRKLFDLDWDRFKHLLDPAIEGVEVTQSIQYHQADQHLTDAADRGPDNSVVLVANKPAWVRVYVRSGLLANAQTVTGQLVVEQRGTALPIWQTTATLSPQPPGTTTTQNNAAYAVVRSTLGDTLNFVLPRELMWGFVRITASIWVQGANPPTPISTQTTTLDVTLLQTLRLRGVLISYNGPNPNAGTTPPPTINLPAPTVADLQATAAWTLTTNPVEANGVFSSAGTLAWTTPLTGVATSPGGCSTQWLNLNAAVAQVRTNDGNRTDVIYYGLLPAGTPIANVGGCESSGVSSGPNGQQVTMAHEVGHGAGLSHAPCGTPGDPNYPAYEPYDPANSPTASLGEYGLDVSNGTIHRPAEKDYMSYCGPVWISLYHQARLTNNAQFNPQRVGVSHFKPPILVDPYLWPWEYIPDPAPPWVGRPGDIYVKAIKVISLLGVVNEDRQFEVQSVMRVTALPALDKADSTPFVAQLIGKEGQVVARAPVMRLPGQGQGCGCGVADPALASRSFVFQALLPDVEPGTALRIVRLGRDDEEDKEVWVRKAPPEEPKIRHFDVHASKGRGSAKWEARATTDQGLEYALQFSKDEGKSWNSLAVGLTEPRYDWDHAHLPSGKVIIRLLAHDGFFTATADSKPLNVPRHPPVVSILSPQEAQPLRAGQTLRLWAAVSTLSGDTIEPKACHWYVDGKEAGRGLDVWLAAPPPGKHECRVVVESQGGKAEATTTFTTVEVK